ncbi:helix-turn-helix domain-containing protein [Streptomyces sp. ATCC 21386]|uniref:helix-turn-helix domain-containing protein n=1 Tax=Streptomyces sp. ATCC 21386 TaxID=2699428 RepID=UPI001BFFB43F|nr:helix-turn-helix domain-containing protein [Streptomyces sp. ATCC 21386]
MTARALTAAEVLALPAMASAWPDGAAACGGIGRTAWYELIARGETPVPVIRVGRSLKVRRSDLLNFLGLQDQAAVEVESAASAEENDNAPGVEPGAPVETSIPTAK